MTSHGGSADPSGVESGDLDVPAYQGLAAHYDEFIGDESFAKQRETFDWIVERYGLRFGSAIDIGCGTGTFVEYLWRCGVDPVWGIDRSPEMLEQAERKNSHNGARFLLQDLRELDVPETVELITCQFETLNYLLTDADLHAAFGCFAGALKPGGFAVFDVASRRPDRPQSPDLIEVSELDSPTVSIRAHYDTERMLQVAHVRVAETTASQSERHFQRIHTIDAIDVALTDTGLALRAMHDNADLQRPAEGAESVVVLAQRVQLAPSGQPAP